MFPLQKLSRASLICDFAESLQVSDRARSKLGFFLREQRVFGLDLLDFGRSRGRSLFGEGGLGSDRGSLALEARASPFVRGRFGPDLARLRLERVCVLLGWVLASFGLGLTFGAPFEERSRTHDFLVVSSDALAQLDHLALELRAPPLVLRLGPPEPPDELVGRAESDARVRVTESERRGREPGHLGAAAERAGEDGERGARLEWGGVGNFETYIFINK